ncbi:MFS transporter [Nocardia sp. NPDC004260]
MGADPDEPKRRKRTQKKQPSPPEPPQPTPEPPAPVPKPTPQPKPRKRSQPSAPLAHEEFVVRDVGEAIGEIGDEGPRVAAAKDARRWVTSLPEKLPWLTADQIETAKLLISEMVANALRWTEGKVAVVATATDTDDTRKTRFTVTDDSKSTWFELHGPRGSSAPTRAGHQPATRSQASAPNSEQRNTTEHASESPDTQAPSPVANESGTEKTASGKSGTSEEPENAEAGKKSESLLHLVRHDSNLGIRLGAEFLNRLPSETAPHAEPSASSDEPAHAATIPRPDGADTTAWLFEVRRYSGLSPEQLDELVGATPGTWQSAELGEAELEKAHVRALLRRLVPDGYTIYTEVAAHYPGLLSRSGRKIYPEGYSRIGEYIRYLRESNGFTQAQLAQLLGKSKSTIEVWERGTRSPGRKMVTALLEKLRFTQGVTVDEITETFSYLPRELPIFPSPRATRSFGEYLELFRRMNNLQLADAARILGYSAETMRSHEVGETARSEDLEMLAAYDRVLHRAGPWNDLAKAWGYSYRMNPAGETFPAPADYRTVHEWMKALRLHQRMTQEQFAEHVGRKKRRIVYTESRSKPGLRFLRELRDTLGMPNDTLVAALRRFYARDDVAVLDETDEALFWELISTPVGSPEEESVRNRIIERYAWVAPLATRYWRIPDQPRDDLIQIAHMAILRAITNFIPPTGNFASFAASYVRYAMLSTLYEYRHPGISDRKSRDLLVKIGKYRDKYYDENQEYPRDSEVAAELGLDEAEVTSARALPGQPLRLDAPTHEGSQNDGYKIAAPAEVSALETDQEPDETSFADERLTDAWNTLSELPDGELAQKILGLRFLDEGELSLAEVSERLHISLDKAQQVMATAIETLRTALPPVDGDGTPQDGDDEGSTSPSGDSEQPRRSGGGGQTPGPAVSFQDVDPLARERPGRIRRFGGVARPDFRVFHHDENDPLGRPYGDGVPPNPAKAHSTPPNDTAESIHNVDNQPTTDSQAPEFSQPSDPISVTPEPPKLSAGGAPGPNAESADLRGSETAHATPQRPSTGTAAEEPLSERDSVVAAEPSAKTSSAQLRPTTPWSGNPGAETKPAANDTPAERARTSDADPATSVPDSSAPATATSSTTPWNRTTQTKPTEETVPPPPLEGGEPPRNSTIEVSGAIVFQTLSKGTAELSKRFTISGLVTAVGPEADSTPTTVIDEAGVPRTTASLVLHAVEAPDMSHPALAGKVGGFAPITITSGDLTAQVMILDRFFESGSAEAMIIYVSPVQENANFETVRALIDSALLQRFPDTPIAIKELHQDGTGESVERELRSDPPGPDAPQLSRIAESREAHPANADHTAMDSGPEPATAVQAPGEEQSQISEPQDEVPTAAGPILRGRPSDTALEVWHRYLDAAEAADGRAQELIVEVEQRIPDAGERAYAKRFAENERRTAALAAELGISLDRLRTLMVEELRQIFDGEIVTRTTSGSLRGILGSGKFKTEFDFAGNGQVGRRLLADRIALEQALFGYPPDLPAESRPIYGFIRTAPSYRVTEGDALAQYGDVDIVFKSTVEERTTAMVGDSKSVAAIPSKVTDPQPESFAATPRDHKTLGYIGLEGINRDYAGKRFTGSSYIEAQVVDPTVSDIDYVVFHRDPPDQLTQELLDRAGIPWSHFFRHPGRPRRSRPGNPIEGSTPEPESKENTQGVQARPPSAAADNSQPWDVTADVPCVVGAFADAENLGFDVQQPVGVEGPVPAAAVSWLAGAHHKRFDGGLGEVAQLLAGLGTGAGMLVNARPVGAAIGHMFLLHNDGQQIWIHDRQAPRPKAIFNPEDPPFTAQTTHALLLTRRDAGSTLESRQRQLGENIVPPDPDIARGRALRPLDAGALPPPHDATYADLRAWAAALSVDDAGTLLTHVHAEAIEHLKAAERGAPPAAAEAVATARALNILVWEQAHRLRADTHPGPINDYATLFAVSRRLAARLPAVRELTAAADTAFTVAGTFGPLAAGATAAHPSVAEWSSTVLHRFPEHLGRAVAKIERSFDSVPWSEESSLTQETVSVYEHVGLTNAAVQQIAELRLYFDEIRDSEGRNWSEMIDRRLTSASELGFDPEFTRAVASLSTEAAAFADAQAGPEQDFARAAASYLPVLTTTITHYVLRTRDVALALDLLDRADRAFAETARRLPHWQPAQDAERRISALHRLIAGWRQKLPDYELPRKMQEDALTIFAPHAGFFPALEQTLQELRRVGTSSTNASRPMPPAEQPSAEPSPSAEQRGIIRRDDDRSPRDVPTDSGNASEEASLRTAGTPAGDSPTLPADGPLSESDEQAPAIVDQSPRDNAAGHADRVPAVPGTPEYSRDAQTGADHEPPRRTRRDGSGTPVSADHPTPNPERSDDNDAGVPSTAQQVTGRGPAEDAAPKPRPALARPTALSVGVTVFENPFDESGPPWDRGGRISRHQRTNRLAEFNADGGGFARAPKGDDEPGSGPANEHARPDLERDSTPTGNETSSEPQPSVQRQPADPAADKPVSIRELLAVNKPFAKLLLGERIVWPPGEVASKLGTVMATSALPYVVLNETDSAMAAGMAGAAVWIPALFELPAGYAADFVNRRKLMIAAQWLGAAAAAAAAGLVFFDAPDLGPWLTAATLAESTAATFYLRAFDAAARDFLTEAHQNAGARLRTLTGQAADISGQALGPALATGVATWAPFGFNTLSYLGNLLNMRGVSFPPQADRVSRNLLREIGEGARTLWQEKFLRDVTAIGAINNAAWAMLGLRTATVVHDADLAGWATGAVVAAPAVGGLMSDFVVRAFDKMDLSTLYQVALANMAVFSVLQASTKEPAVIAVASALDAMMMWATNTRMGVYQQQVIPGELRGRAGSVRGLFLRIGPAAGLLVAGAHGGDAATMGAGITVAAAASYGVLTLVRRGLGAARDASTVDPEVIANCAIHLARVFRALALMHDGSPEPDDTDSRWDARKNWKLVEATLGTQLRPAEYDGDPRFSAVAETVRTKRDGIDLAVVVVDDGENAHPYTFVNVEGQVLVFDTLVDDAESGLPRVRNYDGDENGENKWEPKYHKVVKVFDAYYTSIAGTPSPVRKPVPAYRHIRHPHKMQGRPADPEPQTTPPTDRTGDNPEPRHAALPDGATSPRHNGGYKTVSPPTIPLVSASDVELVRPTVDTNGALLGPDDEPYHTENEQGEPFLVLATGEFVTANSATPPLGDRSLHDAAHSPADAPTRSAELVVRAENGELHEAETAVAAAERAAAWLAAEFTTWPPREVRVARSTLMSMVTDALAQRKGEVHIVAEETADTLRVTLLDTTRDHVAALPGPIAAEGDSPLVRSGVDLFDRSAPRWRQAVWFEIRNPLPQPGTGLSTGALTDGRQSSAPDQEPIVGGSWARGSRHEPPDPALALDLPAQRASGMDGLGFGPPPTVVNRFGDAPPGLPAGVVAHAAIAGDPNGGAFGDGRSEAERIARAALSTFRVEATFDDLRDWAARLSDDNLRHLLAMFTHMVTERIAAIHRGDPPPVTDRVIDPARLLGAIVTEVTFRFSDSVPATTPTTYRELFAIAPWLQANRRTVADLHSAMTAVLDAAYAVTRTSTAHRWSVAAGQHTVPAHVAEIARSIEEADQPGIRLEESSFPPGDALVPEHVRLVESFLRDGVRGGTVARMVMDWAYVMDALLQPRSSEFFSPRYEAIFESLPVHAAALDRARTGSDRLFAATIATALPDLLDAAFYLLPTSNFALGLGYLRQADALLADAATRFPDFAIYALEDAADSVHRLYEDIVVANSRRPLEVRAQQMHEILSDYFSDELDSAFNRSFRWGIRALWGLGSQKPGIDYAFEWHTRDAVLPWDWDTTDDERALAGTALDLLQNMHGPEADIQSLLRHSDSPDLVESIFDSVGKNMRWWYRLGRWTSGHVSIGTLLEGAADFSVNQIQLAVLRQYPHIIGAAGGIEYRARDLANRLSLARDLASPRLAPQQREELAVLRDQLAEVGRGAHGLAIPGSSAPPVLLVSYDPVAKGGTGRAVVSIGEADSASFIAFNVIGADTPVTDLAHWSVHAAQQYEKAQQHAPGDARVAIMFTVGSPHGIGAPARTAGPHTPAQGNVGEAPNVAGPIVARELITYEATRELALDSSNESWARRSQIFTAIGHGDGMGVLRGAADTLRLSAAVDQIVLVPGSADDRLLTASQLQIGTENVYTLNPYRERNDDPNTIGLIMVGHGDDIETATDASSRSAAPLIETPTTVRDISQLLSAHEYRPLGGHRGWTMTRDEGLTVYRAAQPLLQDALSGTYNTTVLLEDLGLVLRVGHPHTASFDPRFGPEHKTLPVISQYVRNAPQLLQVLIGRMPDGRIVDESAPILIERLAGGEDLAETFRRADRRTIRSHHGLILRTFANIHEQLLAMREDHPLLVQLTPPGVARGDTGGWYLNHIDWYTENFYRRHHDRFGALFDEFGLLRGNPFEPLVDDARSMRDSRHHILHADPNEGNFLISNELHVTLLDWELAVTGPSAYDWARLGHLVPAIEVPRELGGPDMVKFARLEKFKRVMNDTVKLAPLAVAGLLTPQLIEFIDTEFTEAVIQVRQLSGHTKLLPPRAQLEILRSWRP